MLASIDCYTKELEQYRPFEAELLPEIKAYYRVGLTYSSTALEGFSYTESETKVLLEEGLIVGGKPLRDALAVTGHARCPVPIPCTNQIESISAVVMWLFFAHCSAKRDGGRPPRALWGRRWLY